MADTPKTVRVNIDFDHPAIIAALEDARKGGVEEGRNEGRREILDWLENKYMGPDRPDRGSPEAKAILQLTNDAAKYIRVELNGGK